MLWIFGLLRLSAQPIGTW